MTFSMKKQERGDLLICLSCLRYLCLFAHSGVQHILNFL